MQKRSYCWKLEDCKQFHDELCILRAIEYLLSENNKKISNRHSNSVFSNEESILLLKEFLSHGQKNIEHIYYIFEISTNDLELNFKFHTHISINREVLLELLFLSTHEIKNEKTVLLIFYTLGSWIKKFGINRNVFLFQILGNLRVSFNSPSNLERTYERETVCETCLILIPKSEYP